MSMSGRDLAKLSRLVRSALEVSSRQPADFAFSDERPPDLTVPPAAPALSLAPDHPILGHPLPPAKRRRYEHLLPPSPTCNSDYSDDEPFPYQRPHLNSQAHKIEQALRRVCELSDTDDEDRLYDEEKSLRNRSLTLAASDHHYIGLRRRDIELIRKYRLQAASLPALSKSFEVLRSEEVSALLSRNSDHRSMPLHRRADVITSLKKIAAYRAYPQASPLKKKTNGKPISDKVETGLIRKAWGYMMKKDIPKGYKSMQKQRGDIRNGCKRVAQLCFKEVQKKANKLQREVKDMVPRAKRLSREVASYWRRKEKETGEMRKKREKEEVESRKKLEEEQESIRQRKRLEYLMKQSELYSHFMAQKLNLPMTYTAYTTSIPIDEEQAKEGVRNIIRQQREHIKKFDRDAGLSNDDLKDVGLIGLDRVDERKMMSRIDAPPASFVGELKDYQLKGLRWLDNLYEQGINGILADEMGLGKTIQTIGLMAHLSCNKGVWGPFLVVCPSSTLHNWQSELSIFCPSLKVLPYWGGLKERKLIRRYLSPKRVGQQDSPFHVCITSYQLILTDDKVFQKINWHYLILDEAQAIKNTLSIRWSTLLGFNSRNRLLLTGTPIQNSMAELWALLHFIMPNLFDSHEQFQEWFSKDIEAHSQDAGTLNLHQLKQLHAILKPFMLRRVKKDVESEIGQKTEMEHFCEMTLRQKVLYNRIKSRLNVSELFMMADSKIKVEKLMNLMMQFRKVCNHPDLFERRPERSPVYFRDPGYQVSTVNFNLPIMQEIRCAMHNPILVRVPRLVWEEIVSRDPHIPELYQVDSPLLALMRLAGLSIAESKRIALSDQLTRAVLCLHWTATMQRLHHYEEFTKPLLSIALAPSQQSALDFTGIYPSIVAGIYRVSTLATPIEITCASSRFVNNFRGALLSPLLKQLVFGKQFRPSFTYESQGQSNPCLLSILPDGLQAPIICPVEIPDLDSLVHDSAKLMILDDLLKKLAAEGHKVLIFCQMTMMLNILEDYLYSRKFTFLRLDGSTPIGDRRVMIEQFQTSEVFIFILSTRAGGLGINLTAADTVIFYDIDWNPTMDAQATDRVHRIGQDKPVTVYRLITKGTVEERILKRAKQKQIVQSTVYAGGAFKADIFRPAEVMELLFDSSEIDSAAAQKFIGGGRKGKKKKEATKEEGEGYNVAELVTNEIS